MNRFAPYLYNMKSSSLTILLKILGRNKWFYLFSSVLFISVIFFRTLEPKIFQLLLDELLIQSNSPNAVTVHTIDIPFLVSITRGFSPQISILLYFSLLYILVTFSRSIVVFGANTINAASTENALSRLRNKLFSHLQGISIHHYIHHSKGEIIQRSTNDLEVVKNFIQNNIVEVIRISFLVIFSTIIMCQINFMITIISLCLMPFVVFLSLRFYNREKIIWEKHEAESDLLNTIIQENIQGIRTIKAYANEPQAIDAFEKQNQRRLDAGIKHIELHSFYWPAMNFIVFLQIVVSNLFAVYMASQGILTIGELLGVGLYVNMMLWPLRQVSSILSNFSMAMVALQRIDELLSIPSEEDISYSSETPLQGKIEFRNVSFQYPGQKNFALKNVNFHIEAGEKVAIIGPTGSGKSTIGKLLLRLHEPIEGHIFIDNRDIRTYSKAYLRQHLGIALQNSILFSASIKENLCSVNPLATDRTIRETMETACIDSLLNLYDEGFGKMIGERGINLSGGQKQRLALARLLLKNPDVFILDDVTSYIDEINEQSILKSLKHIITCRTCIIISHKLSTIVFADKLIALEHGSINQIGRQSSLVGTEGYFNIIYNLQTEGIGVKELI